LELQALRYPSLTVADHAVDAQSLIALADLVVSAGGTMNREAVALGTPVYTTFQGRLGGVDEQLVRERRLRPLVDPAAIELVPRPPSAPSARRDPAVIARMIVEAAS
jgi:predicted glycosyltransferase